MWNNMYLSQELLLSSIKLMLKWVSFLESFCQILLESVINSVSDRLGGSVFIISVSNVYSWEINFRLILFLVMVSGRIGVDSAHWVIRVSVFRVWKHFGFWPTDRRVSYLRPVPRNTSWKITTYPQL